jgi:hypothetical protein
MMRVGYEVLYPHESIALARADVSCWRALAKIFSSLPCSGICPPTRRKNKLLAAAWRANASSLEVLVRDAHPEDRWLNFAGIGRRAQTSL